VKQLFAKWGSVHGTVVLADGTPLCIWEDPTAPEPHCLRMVAKATPRDPDRPGAVVAGCEPLPPYAGDYGFFELGSATAGPHQGFSFRRSQVGHEPYDPDCESPACEAILDRRLVVEPREVAYPHRVASEELEAEEVLERPGEAPSQVLGPHL